MAKPLKKSELKDLLQEVEGALTDILKSESQKLSKAHEGEETSPEVPADKSATADSSASPPADDTSAAPAPTDDASASPPAPPADASAPPSAPADPAADASGSPEDLQGEYMKLGQSDPEALKNHYLACKAAIFAMLGAGADASAGPMGAAPAAPPAGPAASPAMPPAAPPAPPMAPPSPSASPSPDAPPTLKSEMAPEGETPVAKSEKDLVIESLNKRISEQENAFNTLLGVVTTIVERPSRKAIVNMASITKNDQTDIKSMSKAEVKARLRSAAERPNLAKSDRSLIVQFDLGKVSVEQVSHLLVDKK